MMNEEVLPDELLCLILQAVPAPFVAMVARTCRRWFSCSPPGLRHKLCLRGICQSAALLEWAVAEGQLDKAKKKEVCAMLAGRGDLQLLKWVREKHQFPWSEETSYGAADGHLEVLQYAQANGCPCNFRALAERATQLGHLDVLQWAFDRAEGAYRDASYASKRAAECGHLHVLQYLHAKGCKLGFFPRCAAEKGQLHVLQWARQANLGGWDAEDVCSAAARGGRLHLLQWLREHGAHWDSGTCLWAARHGHLEVLQWAVENGCPPYRHLCYYAARGGHLEMLQWARERGFDWDETTCALAAKGGYREVLRWARENGCPWDLRTTFVAVDKEDVELLEWLLRNGCPCGGWALSFLQQKGRLDLLPLAQSLMPC
ncbi:Ankyrin repeat domain containing protein [Balamuthia mandrillaris]